MRLFPHVGLWWALKGEPLLKLFSHCSQLWGCPQRGLTISDELEADFGSNHELLIAKFRLKLKKVEKTTRPFRYDLNLIDRVPEELCREVPDIV